MNAPAQIEAQRKGVSWQAIAAANPSAVKRNYRCEQAHEARERTCRIIDRLVPRVTVYYPFHAQRLHIRSLSYQTLYPRILAKIEARDAAMSAYDMADAIDSTPLDVLEASMPRQHLQVTGGMA